MNGTGERKEATSPQYSYYSTILPQSIDFWLDFYQADMKSGVVAVGALSLHRKECDTIVRIKSHRWERDSLQLPRQIANFSISGKADQVQAGKSEESPSCA